MTNLNQYRILAECNTFEAWTVDENGKPLEFVNDFYGVEPNLYYIDDIDGDYNPEYFDTYEEAKEEMERLYKLLELNQ